MTLKYELHVRGRGGNVAYGHGAIVRHRTQAGAVVVRELDHGNRVCGKGNEGKTMEKNKFNGVKNVSLPTKASIDTYSVLGPTVSLLAFKAGQENFIQMSFVLGKSSFLLCCPLFLPAILGRQDQLSKL